MKKLLISILLLVFSATLFAEPVAQASQKTFKIHSEKRKFVKKGNRHHHGKHHRHGKHNMGNKKKMSGNHKK